MSHGDDPASSTQGEADSGAQAASERIRLPDSGPVAEASEATGGAGKQDAESNRGRPASLAERGSSDFGSAAAHLTASNFTDSLAFQAELVEVAWQGPLPPPQQLGEYERIIPGSALRILAMAETAISGPIQNTAKLTSAEIEASKRGMTFAIALTSVMSIASVVFFALAVAGIGNTAACITAGSVFLSVPVVMLVRAFITRS